MSTSPTQQTDSGEVKKARKHKRKSQEQQQQNPSKEQQSPQQQQPKAAAHRRELKPARASPPHKKAPLPDHDHDGDHYVVVNSSSVRVRGRPRLRVRNVLVNSHRDVLPVLRKELSQWHHPLIDALEHSSGMNREQLFFGACGLVMLYLIIGPGNALLCNLIGFAYPAHQSVMAIRSQKNDDDTQWLIYWCSFGLFSIIDFLLADSINRVLPLYWLFKTAFLLFLALPQTYGAHNIYVLYVDPLFDWLDGHLRRNGIQAV